VRDPRTAEDLCPDYPYGTKRPCLDTNYYQTYNRDNVHLVNLRRTLLAEVTAKGVRTTEREREFDAIVYATGFDAMTGAIAYLEAGGLCAIEPMRQAQDAWVDHVNEVASMTLYPKANSWYLGANVPGKPRVFMPYAGGVGAYRIKCDEVAANGYEGFELSG
jgi:cation diffusion facilitator CzcD-associated flavoprotein CzcO